MRDRYASLREGLVGAWIPSIRGDGLLLPDLSGQGNNGTLTNMDASDWVSGQYGRALDFDGVDDHTNCGNILNSTFAGSSARFTICGWLRTTVNANQVSLSKIDGTLNQRQFFVRANDDGLDFVWYGTLSLPATFRVVRAPLLFSSAGWVSFAVTFDATISNADQKAEIYLKGVKQSVLIVSSSGNPVAIQPGTAPLSFGCFFNNMVGALFFNGQLDDIRIYNRALSEPEIKLLSQEPGVGFKRTRSVFDFGRKPAYLPPTPTDYRTVRVKQTEHASLREGLVGAWCPSIEGSGYTLPDLSGNGNNGALTNMGPQDWVSSQYGRALDFDGVNDYATTSNVVISGNVWTASIWATYRSTATRQCFWSQYTSGTIGRAFLAINYDKTTGSLSANQLSFGTIGGGEALGTGTGTLSINKWYHIAVRAKGSEISLWVNGNQTATAAYSVSIEQSPFTIGRLGNLSTFYLDGLIDDVRAYNRALSESEIKLLASRPGIGLRPQRRTMYYAPPNIKRNNLLIGNLF